MFLKFCVYGEFSATTCPCGWAMVTISRNFGGFTAIATTQDTTLAAIANESHKLYELQFHPGSVHTPNGTDIPFNFSTKISNAVAVVDWMMEMLINKVIAKLREDIGGAM